MVNKSPTVIRKLQAAARASAPESIQGLARYSISPPLCSPLPSSQPQSAIRHHGKGHIRAQRKACKYNGLIDPVQYCDRVLDAYFNFQALFTVDRRPDSGSQPKLATSSQSDVICRAPSAVASQSTSNKACAAHQAGQIDI